MDMNRILHLISNNDLGNVNMIKNHMRNKPCLIFMVAPWCGHCKRLEPNISTLEKDLVEEPEFDPFSIMKIHDEYLPKVSPIKHLSKISCTLPSPVWSKMRSVSL